LERGCVLKESWPKYYVGLKDGALVVRFGSADSDSIERTAPIEVVYGSAHLDCFAKLVDAVETGRRRVSLPPPSTVLTDRFSSQG
jgi:hypothetical protein